MANVRDWWWYWGHVHGVIAYERIFFKDNSAVTARCIGMVRFRICPSRRI